MPIGTEFLLIAFALYLWESALWLPLRGVVLRRRWRGESWRPLNPASFIALRDSGLVMMLPLPPDGGLAPCQAPPLLADDQGHVGLAIGSEEFRMIGPLEWADIAVEPGHLTVKGHRVSISSPRAIAPLSRGRARGLAPAPAIRRMWRLALSPCRASREWRKWRLVSRKLRLLPPLLTLGFFAGIPAAYTLGGILPTLVVVLHLWLLMAGISCHLWWLGKRAYPAARSALRMDAFVSLIVPFHAMRALESTSRHAMATTHPAALLLATGDLENPWLAGFFRRLRHPRPGIAGDAIFSKTIRPHLAGRLPPESAPDRRNDPDSTGWCPRCHSLYLPGADTCPDCRDLPLARPPAPVQVPEGAGA
jgi:hypothetical protein